MRRSRWTRSSLLVPALLIELAAETGTLLRGMNAVMCHDEVVVAAAHCEKQPPRLPVSLWGLSLPLNSRSFNRQTQILKRQHTHTQHSK